MRALSAEHGQQTLPLAAAAVPGEPEVNVLGGQEEEGEEEEVMEPVGDYAVVEEQDLPVYDPAEDDFVEEGGDAAREGEEEEEEEEGPEGVLLAEARHYLHQVANEVNILDEIEAAALVRGSGAAIRARMALVLVEEEVRGALRAAVGAVELHRVEVQRLVELTRVLQAEGLLAQERAFSDALLLEETRIELALLYRRIRGDERNGH